MMLALRGGSIAEGAGVKGDGVGVLMLLGLLGEWPSWDGGEL
jgi:hypothetical protein